MTSAGAYSPRALAALVDSMGPLMHWLHAGPALLHLLELPAEFQIPSSGLPKRCLRPLRLAIVGNLCPDI